MCRHCLPIYCSSLVSSCTFPSGLYHFLHISHSVHQLPLSCFSSIPLCRFHPPCDGLIFMVGLSPVHGSIYFGSLLFLISFITTALFPSALYLLGAVLCPTHLNPLLSCVSVLCEVKKTPIFTIGSLFGEFHCDSQHYMPGTWTVSWLIAANFTSQCNFDIPNHHHIKTPNRIRLLDDLLESLDLVLAELHCFTFTQLFCILQTLKHYLR